MKIAQVIIGLSSGGAERLVVDLVNEWSKEGHEVSLITLKDDTIHPFGFYKKELSTSVNYINIGIVKGFTLSQAFQVFREIKKIKPEILHFHLGKTMFYLLLPILFYRKPKYFETLHNRADKVNQNTVQFLIKWMIYKMNLVRIFTISKDNQLSFFKTYKQKDAGLIYNGRSKTPPTEFMEGVKEEIKLLKQSENDIVFLHIGRCVEQKNQKMLISTFNNLADKGINYILLIIGEGFDSKEGIELKKMANPRIHFLGTHSNVQDYFYCADAFCLSSIFEGMPITLIEAFSCGTPTISTPTSGAIDIIENEKNGIISNDYTTESFEKALLKFIEIQHTLSRETLKQYYSEHLSIEKCAQHYYAAFTNESNK